MYNELRGQKRRKWGHKNKKVALQESKKRGSRVIRPKF